MSDFIDAWRATLFGVLITGLWLIDKVIDWITDRRRSK